MDYERTLRRIRRRRAALLLWFLRTDGVTCNCGRGKTPEPHHWACRSNTRRPVTR